MNERKRTLIVFVLVTFSFIVGILLEYFNIGDPYPAEPLYIFSGAVLISSIALLFFPSAFPKWSKFAGWWVIATVIIVLLSPEYHGALFPLASFDRRDAMWLMGILFTIISLTIIAVKSLQARQKNS